MLERGETEGVATVGGLVRWGGMGWGGVGGRVDLLLMASDELVLTKVLTMSGLKIQFNGGRKREADYRGVCAITYKKLNKDG